jgi:hypothetical protein
MDHHHEGCQAFRHSGEVPASVLAATGIDRIQQARMHASEVSFDARHSIRQLHYYRDDIAIFARFCYTVESVLEVL